MEEKQNADWVKRIKEILHEEGLRNVHLNKNDFCRLGQIMEDLKIEAFLELISQERQRAKMEVLQEIQSMIMDNPDLYIRIIFQGLINALQIKKEALKEEVGT